jgi:hypothetical protein
MAKSAAHAQTAAAQTAVVRRSRSRWKAGQVRDKSGTGESPASDRRPEAGRSSRDRRRDHAPIPTDFADCPISASVRFRQVSYFGKCPIFSDDRFSLARDPRRFSAKPETAAYPN